MDRASLHLTVAFRTSGWQWPLRPDDVVRVFGADMRPVAELPGDLVIRLVEHHLAALTLQGRIAGHLLRPPAPPKPMLPDPPAAPGVPRLLGTHGRKLRSRRDA